MIDLKRLLSSGFALAALYLIAPSDTAAQINSTKRGYSDGGSNYDKLQVVNAAWYYTWGSTPKSIGTYNADFYPMFWNAPSQTAINNAKALNPKYILGFNEPERDDQANMSVSAAVASWDTIYSSFAGTSTKLVSPAVSDTTDGRAWLSSFMAQESSKVDAVAFHWYGISTPDATSAINNFLGSVNLYHNTYNKPVFITEFGIHDWAGSYTDAQIIEANRQFLSSVIPTLESSAYSFVLGYCFFPFFSDGPLYSGSGSNLTPTQMGYGYVGAIGTGAITNIGGQNLGERVADMTGGQLTMTGSAGTIKYINALANASTITGSIDWGLAGSANWVRVQPGATLTKTGTNQITFSNGTVTNNGVLEVAQGTLQLGSTTSGSGTVRVKGGTLVLTSTGTLGSLPLVDVRAGGTLNVAAKGNFSVVSGQNLNNDGNSIGNFFAASSSTISGGGTFSGNLTAQPGSIVRVGKDGLGVPSRYIVDNFESYALGDVKTVSSPPWTAHQDTSFVDIENDNGNKVLTFGWASDFRGVSRTMPSTTLIDNSSTATIFFRINSKTDTPNHSVGLGDQASTGAVEFADYEAQLRLKQGTTAGTFTIDARNGGAFSSTLANGLALNTYYNVWMVVNQATDKYDIYLNTGTGAATTANKLNASQLSFRNGTSNDLNQILALAGAAPIDNGVRIDDFVYQAGADLTNPMAGFNPNLAWTPQTLTVSGNYTQNAGATLQLNLSSPLRYDVLRVTGPTNVGGTLNITFAIDAPSAARGDKYRILDSPTILGTFDALQLPALGGTLGWNASHLYSTGTLSVIDMSRLPGDLNDDHHVTTADLPLLEQALADPASFLAEQGISAADLAIVGDANESGTFDNADLQGLIDELIHGTIFLVGSGPAPSDEGLLSVPEPSSQFLLWFGLIVLAIGLRPKKFLLAEFSH